MLPWLGRGLELLWLATVLLVPLVFLRILDAPLPLPSPMETAKIAVFRTLVSLMAILWLIEWALRGRLPWGLYTGWRKASTSPTQHWLSRLKVWIVFEPTRWVIVAVIFFLSALVLGTLFSVSYGASLWGRVPGTDNSAAYTSIGYFILFGVIATHLKSPPQLGRLLGAIVLVGTAVGCYAVLQYYGQDFLRLADPNYPRMVSTMGNPIFAGSFLLMTIIVSEAVASSRLAQLTTWASRYAKAGMWSMILAVQLAGLTFTFSRGPWVGTAISLGIFLVLLVILLSRHTLGKVVLTLVVVGGVVPLVIVLVLTGLVQPRSDFGEDSTLERVEGRFTSIQPDASISSLGQRFGIWLVSAEVIRSRPWFEFDGMPLPWLRPIVGYGPDLFAPVFMLRSTPVGSSQLPLETNHPHNYLIYQLAELGILGLLGVTLVFVAPLLAAGWQMLKPVGQMQLEYRLLLAGLIAVLCGRFVEQLVGVAKVSDLVLFWTLLAVLVSLPAVMANSERSQSPEAAPQVRRRRSRRDSRRASPRSAGALDPSAYARIGIAGLLIAAIVSLTWVSNFSNLRALMAASNLNRAYLSGDLRSSLAILDRSSGLAPGVFQYRNAAGTVYSAYLAQSEGASEPGCSATAAAPGQYELCLTRKVYGKHVEEAKVSHWRWVSHLQAAEAAEDLASLTQDPTLAEETILRYREASQMVPFSWRLHNQLARVYISGGQADAGLEAVERSLAITGDTANSAEAKVLQGLAYRELDRFEEALTAYGEAIRVDPDYILAYFNQGNIYNELGQHQLAVESYDEAVRLDPEYAAAHYNRGRTYVLLGQDVDAIADFGRAIQIEPGYVYAYVNRALAYARRDMADEAQQDVERAVELGVDRTLLENSLREVQSQSGTLELEQ